MTEREDREGYGKIERGRERCREKEDRQKERKVRGTERERERG